MKDGTPANISFEYIDKHAQAKVYHDFEGFSCKHPRVMLQHEILPYLQLQKLRVLERRTLRHGNQKAPDHLCHLVDCKPKLEASE